MRKMSGYGPSLIVLATAMLVLFAGPGAVRTLTYQQTSARQAIAISNLERNNILEQLNQAYRDVASIVEPSVVHISAVQTVRDLRGRPRSASSSGSGWVWDEHGHIVTNYHVVEDAQRIEVQLSNGETRDATITGYDRFTDIAVIKIPPGRLHPAFRADASKEVERGDIVFAFGSPFNFRFSMSRGIVSAKGRAVGVINPSGNSNGMGGYEDFIQVDAAINPGNSGGPLTDYRGEVVGMSTAIATGSRGSDMEEGQFAGIGLAIPLSMIEPVVTQLIEKGVVHKGFLGVNLVSWNEASDSRQRVRNIPPRGELRANDVHMESPVISRVTRDSPAARGGLREADLVTHMNGQTVESVPMFRRLIGSMQPDEVAELTVLRYVPEQDETRRLTLEITLGKLDELMQTGVIPADQNPNSIPQLGIRRMATSTPELAREYKTRHYPGVILEELVRGSALDRRVNPGVTIVSVQDIEVETVEKLVNVLRRYNLRQTQVQCLGIDSAGREVTVVLGGIGD